MDNQIRYTFVSGDARARARERIQRALHSRLNAEISATG